MTEHPVLAALRERSESNRLALVIEGGGMRGVVSAAMTASIERAGLTEAFDLAVGTSAGALNAAALLAGVAEGNTAEYSGAFATRRFINLARLLVGRPAVDVAYVLGFSSERLDADRHRRTLASPIGLHCVATDVESAAPVDLTGMRTPDELEGALLATSRLPLVGGPPVKFRGRRFLDGGLVEPVPVSTALALGATHVLVLLTRPRGAEAPPVGGRSDALVERRLRRLNPALVDAYRRRPALYAETTARVAEASERPDGPGPHILGCWLPEGAPVPGRLERDADRLRAAAALGARAADALLMP